MNLEPIFLVIEDEILLVSILSPRLILKKDMINFVSFRLSFINRDRETAGVLADENGLNKNENT